MGKTTITHPDGTHSVIESRSGCASGCSSLFWAIVAVYVVAAPATYFPLPAAVMAYVVEALVVGGAVVVALRRRM